MTTTELKKAYEAAQKAVRAAKRRDAATGRIYAALKQAKRDAQKLGITINVHEATMTMIDEGQKSSTAYYAAMTAERAAFADYSDSITAPARIAQPMPTHQTDYDDNHE